MKKRMKKAKRKSRVLSEQGTAFFSIGIDDMHPQLMQHLHGQFAQSLHYDAKTKKYAFKWAGGEPHTCGGLVRTLKSRFYAHYKDNRSKRQRGETQVKGSTR